MDRASKPGSIGKWTAAVAVLAVMASGCGRAGRGFTVGKNVNSLEPPTVRAVIFDKSAGHEHIELVDRADGSAPGFADDGAIEFVITGNKKTEPTIYFKDIDGLGDSFDGTQYNFLVVSFKMDGQVKRTHDNGRVTSSRPGNLWFTFLLLDAEGKRTGQENTATLTDDKTTPAAMTEVKIPLSLVTGNRDADATKIKGIGFAWGRTHAYNDRQFRLVVDRIVLAD